MYYFLAITLDENVRDGTFWPAYVLCKSWTTNSNRSNWRIIMYEDGVPTYNLPKVLVTETYGHDDMIKFMSSYQKKDYKTKKHYHPRGALCWFSCNQYGDPMGTAVFIKRVPEFVWIFNFKEKGYQQLKKDREKIREVNELLASDVKLDVMSFTDKKASLHQQSHRQDLKEWRTKHDKH